MPHLGAVLPVFLLVVTHHAVLLHVVLGDQEAPTLVLEHGSEVLAGLGKAREVLNLGEFFDCLMHSLDASVKVGLVNLVHEVSPSVALVVPVRRIANVFFLGQVAFVPVELNACNLE